MKRGLILCVLFSLIYSKIQAQHELGIKLNGGLSLLSPPSRVMESGWASEKYIPQLSGQGGLFYIHQFYNKYRVGVELLFMQIEGRQDIKSRFTDSNGILERAVDGTADWHLSYIGVPIYFGIQVNKFTFNLGFQANILVTSQASIEFFNFFHGETSTGEMRFSKLYPWAYNLGPRAAIFYKLSDKFSLEANYYYGLTNIDSQLQINPPYTWRAQQISAGIRWQFNQSKVPKEEGESESSN